MNLVGQLGKTQSNRVSSRKNPVKPSGNERNQDNLIPVITDYFIETQWNPVKPGKIYPNSEEAKILKKNLWNSMKTLVNL